MKTATKRKMSKAGPRRAGRRKPKTGARTRPIRHAQPAQRRAPKDVRVALFAGGTSSEREISIKSAKGVAGALQELHVTYRMFDPASPRMAVDLLRFRPHVAFIAMHGPGGEDGRLQGFLDTVNIPYAGPGVASSALCMNKLYTKWAFEALGIPTPRWAYIEPRTFISDRTVEGPTRSLPPFPVFVKPVCEGSSIGVKFLKTEEELHAHVARNPAPILVEERIVGRELTLPVFGEPMEMLPVIEIRPKSEFFDLEAKYTKGMTEYICPADISPELCEVLRHHARHLCRALDLRHMSRIDVMIETPASDGTTLPGMAGTHPPEGRPFFLEINTIPGLTQTSLLPMSARASGVEFREMIRRLLVLAGAEL